MLRTRILSAAVFIPLAVALLLIGDWIYALAVVIILAIGGFEYVGALRQGGYRPYQGTLITAIVLIAGAQAVGLMPALLGPGMAFFLIIAMVAMLAAYGRGDNFPAINFGLTLGGALYIGWLGAHFIAIRQLPNGQFWALISVLATGFGDVGAFFVGRAFGHHKMSPVVSPGKTWEGYFGGVITSAGVGALVAAVAAGYNAAVQGIDGALIGLLAGFTSPVGDLGLSAIKRMVHVKNFSNVIPGHGGMLDRLDSMFVGVPVSYYLILWLLL